MKKLPGIVILVVDTASVGTAFGILLHVVSEPSALNGYTFTAMLLLLLVPFLFMEPD